MPLNRTPPKGTPTEVGTELESAESLQFSGSAPNLSVFDIENVTSRKRKHDDISSMIEFMDEIRSMLDKSTKKNERKLSSLESKIEELISQNNDIMTSIDFITNKYDELQSRMDEAKNERKADRLLIHQLETKVENLERALYSTRLELKNVPKKENEVKDDLCDVIMKTGNVIGISIQDQEIKEVFRTKGKPDRPGTVVVDFVSAVKRDKFIKKTRDYNRKNSANKLNTKHLSFDGPEKPVFISESLSPRGHHLYHLARSFASENAYKFCWISSGKVYLRRETNERYIRVDSEEVLSKLSQAK
ncbi:hypothetical protein ABMA27_014531 [Loxostege sticticalis]|uniref:FP protein C-terminal domain-containing protein n=1 Tax=Loxostege sticticalis TaxID=481309 RepID=A0ABR3I993_LOXSC